MREESVIWTNDPELKRIIEAMVGTPVRLIRFKNNVKSCIIYIDEIEEAFILDNRFNDFTTGPERE